MTRRGTLRGLISRRVRMILSFLELLGLNAEQFGKLRKLILDQLGESGLEGDLAPLLIEGRSEGNGQGRDRQGMKGG